MTINLKKWATENVTFLITLVLGAIAIWSTFQTLVYRVEEAEADVTAIKTKIETLIVPRTEFDTLKNQVNDIWKYLLDK